MLLPRRVRRQVCSPIAYELEIQKGGVPGVARRESSEATRESVSDASTFQNSVGAIPKMFGSARR